MSCTIPSGPRHYAVTMYYITGSVSGTSVPLQKSEKVKVLMMAKRLKIRLFKKHGYLVSYRSVAGTGCTLYCFSASRSHQQVVWSIIQAAGRTWTGDTVWHTYLFCPWPVLPGGRCLNLRFDFVPSESKAESFIKRAMDSPPRSQTDSEVNPSGSTSYTPECSRGWAHSCGPYLLWPQDTWFTWRSREGHQYLHVNRWSSGNHFRFVKGTEVSSSNKACPPRKRLRLSQNIYWHVQQIFQLQIPHCIPMDGIKHQVRWSFLQVPCSACACALLVPESKQVSCGKFTNLPYSDWKHVHDKAAKHQGNTYHEQAVAEAEVFVTSIEISKCNINNWYPTLKMKQIQENRTILRSITHAMLFCAK